MHVTVASPRGHLPHLDVTRKAIELAAEHGGSVNVLHEPRSVVEDADVVLRGGETIDGPSWLAREQAANRLPTAQAILHTVIGGD
jgi:ornithine carbamoyltransferase